jgi:hypothetical protein
VRKLGAIKRARARSRARERERKKRIEVSYYDG